MRVFKTSWLQLYFICTDVVMYKSNKDNSENSFERSIHGI